MATAQITDNGIVVTFDPSEVSVPGSQSEPDVAAIEAEFVGALADIGLTVERVDAVTRALPWAETCDGSLRQIFAWLPGHGPESLQAARKATEKQR